MASLLLTVAVLVCGAATPRSSAAHAGERQTGVPEWLTPYRDAAARLIAAATADEFAWNRLAELTDTYGARLTGSENLTHQ